MRIADNLNGTFTNPVIFADYPDPDMIRVGDDFYLASSSFTDAPGIPICHSRDLVNWRIIGHVYERLPASNPAYSMLDGQVAYRGGSWAPSLRHHKGVFYVAYCMPNEGFFLARSPKPEGPYEITQFGGVELYDPGLFFDDDDRVYVVHGANDIYLTELTPDARAIAGPPRLLYSTAYGNPLEGSHVHKLRGHYYVCNASRGYNGLQVVYRAEHIHGPYESRLLTADDMNYAGAGLHQGGFIDLPNGDLWFCLFQDRDYVGRVPVLLPVTWRDGWPVLGDAQNFGRITATCPKPALPPSAPSSTEGSDSFDAPAPGLAWHWNHNPDDARWSLSARPGWLRLQAGPAPDLLRARNTLTQKITGGGCTATTLLDASALREGDLAGLCVFGFPYAYIAVEQSAAGRRFVMVNDARRVAETAVPPFDVAWLRAEADAEGLARFSYSLDGEVFTALGDELVMQFSVKSFLGNKFGLFCFNSSGASPSGHADFDFLRYECARASANHYRAGEAIPAVAYDVEHGVDTQRVADKRPTQHLVCLHDADWFRFDHLDCGTGVDRLALRYLAIGDGGSLEVRLQHAEGSLLARCELPGTGQRWPWLCTWETKEFPLPTLPGVQSLCFCVRGGRGELFRLDRFWLQPSLPA
jgi:beta-xylosidase